MRHFHENHQSRFLFLQNPKIYKYLCFHLFFFVFNGEVQAESLAFIMYIYFVFFIIYTFRYFSLFVSKISFYFLYLRSIFAKSNEEWFFAFQCLAILIFLVLFLKTYFESHDNEIVSIFRFWTFNSCYVLMSSFVLFSGT